MEIKFIDYLKIPFQILFKFLFYLFRIINFLFGYSLIAFNWICDNLLKRLINLILLLIIKVYTLLFDNNSLEKKYDLMLSNEVDSDELDDNS